MLLSQDFKEFIKSLNTNNVEYLIIGGYAVAYHGHPRYTRDLDIWIGLSSENAKNMIAALSDFGFDALQFSAADFLQPQQTIQLGYPPHRIDILTSADGVDFGACFAERKVISIDSISVNFIDIEGLRENKRATGRYQDLADLENLDS